LINRLAARQGFSERQYKISFGALLSSWILAALIETAMVLNIKYAREK